MRLIDADALLERMKRTNRYFNVKFDIEEAPTIEAEPVRHGRWEWFEEWSSSTPESPKECTDCGWRCGRCKVKLDDMVGWYWDDPHDEPKLNYCPNCGMRTDKENEFNINYCTY